MIAKPFICDRQNNSVIKKLYNLTLNEQRHSTVYQVIKKNNIKRVLDLGCCEGEFLRLLSRSSELQLIAGMDCDPDSLLKAIQNSYPQHIQNSIQFDRSHNLKVQIYQGNLIQEYSQLKDLEFQAVTFVEVIQHLELNIVPLATKTIFGYLKPRIVVITTPNIQFNTHFEKSEDTLRHWDHKFEWTRKQFKDYCENVEQTYGYKYQLSGIGEHISDQTKGCCTQMAIFTIQKNEKIENGQINLEKYNKQGKQLQINQDSPFPSLKIKAQYTIKCWKDRIDDIILEMLFTGLNNKFSSSLENLIESIRISSPLEEALSKNNILLSCSFVIPYLQKFSDIFQWSNTQYWLKKQKSQTPNSSVLRYDQQIMDFLAENQKMFSPHSNNLQQISIDFLRKIQSQEEI